VDALPTTAGLTVLEVLEKAPGVVVDKDGNISLKGKQGVLVLVDGRPTYLSGQDLANMLKNMPGGNLDQLEIMTNPPAKYDATGNSGIINIKTKKNKTVGFNGSASANYGQGVYPKVNNSINLNYRNGKFNFFANGGYNYNERFQNIDITRNFRDKNTNALSSMFEQYATNKRSYNSYSYKAGMDYFLSKKTTFGIVVNGYNSNGNEFTNNLALIKDATGLLTTTNTADNEMKQKNGNTGVNINFRQLLDTTGSEITSDIDYLHYSSGNRQSMNNYFFDALGNKKAPDEKMKGYLPADLNIYSMKIDYTHPLNKTSKMEAGIKSSYVETDNNALYDNWNGTDWVTDAGRSNHFKYNENINAAYVNFNKELNKHWSVQTGLRLENTVSKGSQLTTGETFKRDYTQLFPTAYIGYKLNDKNQFALSYGRRIDRPDYESLNPFYHFLDKYTYEVGNPYLSPQFSHNIELAHTFGGFLTTTLNYSTTKDIIQTVIDQVDSTNTTFIRRDNIAKQQNIGLSISAMVPIAKWWKANIYTNLFNNKYTGLVNGGYIDVQGTTLTTNISNQFGFGKGWNAELSGNYMTRQLSGTLVQKPMGIINFAVTKQVLKNKGTLKLNIRDMFRLQEFNGYSKYQNVDVTVHQVRDNRIVNIGFSYRFGKGKPVQQRKRGGAGDEQSRVNGGGN
jgi:outer membrane receptor protein involved in Fe transport